MKVFFAINMFIIGLCRFVSFIVNETYYIVVYVSNIQCHAKQDYFGGQQIKKKPIQLAWCLNACLCAYSQDNR